MRRNQLTPAETAAVLRAALAQVFPGCKFSVTTNSTWHAIEVAWTDGPTREQVNALDIGTNSGAYWPSSEELANKVCQEDAGLFSLPVIREGDLILEPEAGTGVILKAMLARFPQATIHYCEINWRFN